MWVAVVAMPCGHREIKLTSRGGNIWIIEFTEGGFHIYLILIWFKNFLKANNGDHIQLQGFHFKPHGTPWIAAVMHRNCNIRTHVKDIRN